MPDLDTKAQDDIEVAVVEMQNIVVRLRTETDASIRTALAGRFEVLRTIVNKVIASAYRLGDADMAAILGD